MVERDKDIPGHMLFDTESLTPGDNGLLIQYGLQCEKCEKHWFELPVHRMEAVKEFSEASAEMARIPTRAEFESISPDPHRRCLVCKKSSDDMVEVSANDFEEYYCRACFAGTKVNYGKGRTGTVEYGPEGGTR
jgi:hypothetical protein